MTTFEGLLSGLFVCTQLTNADEISEPLNHLFINYNQFLGGYPIPQLVSSQDILKIFRKAIQQHLIARLIQKKQLIVHIEEIQLITP